MLPSTVVSERQFGLATHPNTMGFLAVLVLPFAIFWLGRSGVAWKVAGLVSPVILGVGVVVSGSRAAMAAGLVAAAASYVALSISKRWYAVGVPLVLAGCAAGLRFGVGLLGRTRLGASAATLASDAARARVNTRVMMDFEQSPVFGLGFDAGAASTYGFLLAGGGLLATIGFVLYLTHATSRGFALLRSDTGDLAMPTLLALAALLAMSFVANPVDARAAYVFLAVAAGYSVRQPRVAADHRVRTPVRVDIG